MAEILASKPLVLAGREYRQGERIPAEAIAKLPPRRLEQLIAQRRVAEQKVRLGRPPKEG